VPIKLFVINDFKKPPRSLFSTQAVKNIFLCRTQPVFRGFLAVSMGLIGIQREKKEYFMMQKDRKTVRKAR
jgi:hypothetical protein